MDKTTVYLELNSQVEEVLRKQKIDLVSLIKNSALDINVSFKPIYLEGEKNNSKDIVTVIIASSAALSSVLIALSKLLDTYFYRPHFYEWDELEEIIEDGKIKTDAYNNPIWKVKRKHEVINADTQKSEQKFEFNAGVKGVILKVCSSKK